MILDLLHSLWMAKIIVDENSRTGRVHSTACTSSRHWKPLASRKELAGTHCDTASEL